MSQNHQLPVAPTSPFSEATNRRGIHHSSVRRGIKRDGNDADLSTTPKTAPRPLSYAQPTAHGTPSTAIKFSSLTPFATTPQTLGKENQFHHHHQVHDDDDDSTAVASLEFTNPYLLRPIGPNEEPPVLTLVFDLDETLVNNRRVDLPQAILRPYVEQVLKQFKNLKGVEVVMWTASTEDTAAPVVRQLSGSDSIFKEVIFRNDMWFTEPFHTKDIRLLGRPLDRILVVDNAPNCVKMNAGHAVLVDDFTGYCNQSDTTLINVFRIVEVMAREISERGFTVTEVLEALAAERVICKKVTYELPEAWRRVNLDELHPLRVPPHGDFFKVQLTPW